MSRNNRLIERHESGGVVYWVSYDFGGNVGRQNLFAHPLGPGDGAAAFRHDGGEIIFSLPNGLQAYFLADGAGKRLDKGPTAIVSDSRRPDRAVENGLSCMRPVLVPDGRFRRWRGAWRAAYPLLPRGTAGSADGPHGRELSGRSLPPGPAEIIRTVGNPPTMKGQ